MGDQAIEKESVRTRGFAGLTAVVAMAAVAVKIALLLTSQSMADGDEAITGLMAMDIAQGRGHPIYPYGIPYGAGAGLEAHLAAVAFRLWGVSSIALKSAGLVIWSVNLALVAAIARRLGGLPMSLAAVLLFGFSPPNGMLSLKVEGGHQVAVMLCLVMMLLVESEVRPAWIVPLAPFAIAAHPVAWPFTLVLVIYLLVRGPRRARSALALCGATLLAIVLLWPDTDPEQSGWDPRPTAFQPVLLLQRADIVVLNLFGTNLNATTRPHGTELAVSLAWLLVFALALVQCRVRRLWLYAASVPGILVLVSPEYLAARHLLMLQPIACLVIAQWAVSRGRLGGLVVLLLALAGATLQLRETASPYIYGAGRQAGGLERAMVQSVLARLEAANIRHVYTTEAMLHWVLIFESKDRIAARWRDPLERLPQYAEQVDAARDSGLPIAVLLRTGPKMYTLDTNPDRAALRDAFPPARPHRR